MGLSSTDFLRHLHTEGGGSNGYLRAKFSSRIGMF